MCTSSTRKIVVRPDLSVFPIEECMINVYLIGVAAHSTFQIEVQYVSECL